MGTRLIHLQRERINMKTIKLLPAMLALLGSTAFAQTAVTEMQRDVNQQQRIEQGLQSGQLNTREAARLERGQAKVNRVQAQSLKDGQLSAAEKQRLQRMQNKASSDIKAEKHDAHIGNPDSASSRRMQADVQRNINQEKRIDAGIKDGSLTAKEAARMERGQAHDNRMQSRAGRDGHVGAGEQNRIQHKQNKQSGRIRHERHDPQHRG